MSVRDDLSRFGPQQSETVSLAAAEVYCARLAQQHYENFPVVTWLLPARLRQHFYNVYAYCRWADDLGDELHDEARSLELLSWWRTQLHRCFARESQHPVFVALRSTINQFEIPVTPFDDLISAFEQDQTVREYETYAQLRDYCRRSADPVGRIVLYLCEVYNDERAALSDSVCTGLQLANFWQDIRRDAEIGRIYLPREDRLQFNYSANDFAARRQNDAFRALMQYEIDRARQLLMAGLPLVPQLPGRIQVDIDLFIQGGLLILQGIERIDGQVWERRPTVSKWGLAWATVGSLLRMCRRRLRSIR